MCDSTFPVHFARKPFPLSSITPSRTEASLSVGGNAAVANQLRVANLHRKPRSCSMWATDPQPLNRNCSCWYLSYLSDLYCISIVPELSSKKSHLWSFFVKVTRFANDEVFSEFGLEFRNRLLLDPRQVVQNSTGS